MKSLILISWSLLGIFSQFSEVKLLETHNRMDLKQPTPKSINDTLIFAHVVSKNIILREKNDNN